MVLQKGFDQVLVAEGMRLGQASPEEVEQEPRRDVLSKRNNPHGLIHPERLMGYLPPLVRKLVEDGA